MSIQKKLSPALLIMLGLASTAHAENTLNLYGVLDVSFGSVENAHLDGVKARTTTVDSNRMTTSFIGFRGSEDIGGGLKAQFTLESFLRPDTGAEGRSGTTDPMWSRNANVALVGGFGKVAVGRTQNLIYGQEIGFNPFGGSFGVSPIVRLTYGIGWINPTTGASATVEKGDSGWSNTIAYYTPNLSGFTGAVVYQAGESSDSSEGDSYALGGTYVNGPFAVTLGYQELKSAEAPKSNFTDGQKQKFGLLGVSYDFGVVKAYGQIGQIKNDGFTTALAAGDIDLYQVGVSIPVTATGKILASYGQGKYKPDANTGDIKHTIVAVGYDYNLSKRTDVYANFMYDDQTDLKSGNTYMVGVRHAF